MAKLYNNHSGINELIIQACNEIRKILKIDDLSYSICPSNLQDPRTYFLHNVLTEIEKGALSVMLAIDFLSNNKTDIPLSQEDRQLNSKILQSKIDELSLWSRKSIEILIDLIGFEQANTPDYYKHYNYLEEIRAKRRKCDDNRECDNSINLKQEAQLLSKKLSPDKCWYAVLKKGSIQLTLSNVKDRFEKVLPQAKNYQQSILVSYSHSFGKKSESLHPKNEPHKQLKTLEDFEHAIANVSTLALYVISAIGDILEAHNTNGPFKQIANAIKQNPLPAYLLYLRTNSINFSQ